MAAILLAAAMLAGGGVAHADGWPLGIAADASTDTGYVTLVLVGSPNAHVEVGERVDFGTRPLGTAELADHGGVGVAILKRAARWSCRRRTRHFVAAAQNVNGTVETAAFSVRTPSCRDRLTVRVPRAARPGARVRIKLLDRWGIGGLDGRLCTASPRRRARCRAFRIPTGQAGVTPTFRPGRTGSWGIEVRGPGDRVRRSLNVGAPSRSGLRRAARPTILMTGDSLMQSIDALVGDRLRGRAQVRSDIQVGTGLSKYVTFDWARRARRQAARLRPDATVMFLGSNEGAPMTTPARQTVQCCDEPWIVEYSRRVATVMTYYVRRGKGRLFWFSLPTPRDERRRPIALAVNAAVARAAARVRGAYVVHLDRVLSPGWSYRDTITYRGRRVRVREGDGIHLSIPGAAIATSILIRELRRRGPL
ncbi:MAG: GDSL-type esterase/lipase family protein [Chloroflexota bacterium]|nr:GDSL-type esterase/lipase family protein [Chloroflexota bacterium]